MACPYLEVLLRVLRVFLSLLVKKKLHKKVNNKDETVEVCCFFYAGLVFRWFDMYANTKATWARAPDITQKLSRFATGNVTEVISIANQYYYSQQGR